MGVDGLNFDFDYEKKNSIYFAKIELFSIL